VILDAVKVPGFGSRATPVFRLFGVFRGGFPTHYLSAGKNKRRLMEPALSWIRPELENGGGLTTPRYETEGHRSLPIVVVHRPS